MKQSQNRKPPWLRVQAFSGAEFQQVDRLVRQHNLNTVCHAANCPNRGSCFSRGTATFMILGSNCTRSCRFCNVTSGRPFAVDQDEPVRLAKAAAILKLKHVVVTSVTRDDLPDGGAGHFAETTRQIRKDLPGSTIELLIPDMQGSTEAYEVVAQAGPEILNHNVETIERLYSVVRPQAEYQRSLDLLQWFATHSRCRVKSGLMLGLGETQTELIRLFDDLAGHSVSILTIGQYLQPTKEHLAVERYLDPEEFDHLGRLAQAAGIADVLSAPLARSSYKAERFVHS